jgi:hypothetical protein
MTPGWDQRHQTAYREGAWDRVQRHAWTLTQRHMGWHVADAERYEAEGDPPEAARERSWRWLPASLLLALSLWRAARAADQLVDEIPLNRALWWLGGQEEAQLFAEPLPSWQPGLPGNWRRLQDRSGLPDLINTAREIPTWHVLRDIEENRLLADSDDGTEPPPLLLGDRVRAVEAGPYRDDAPPRWRFDVEHASRSVTRAEDQALHGVWAISDGVREAAEQLLPTLRAEPDTPAAPDHVEGHTWVQRACRLDHIRRVIRTVLSAHEDPQLRAHPRYPAGQSLTATVLALDAIASTARDLEALWATRSPETGVAAWERAHVPVPLRDHVLALESLVRDVAALSVAVLVDPDEPH